MSSEGGEKGDETRKLVVINWPAAVKSVGEDVALVFTLITLGQMAGCVPWYCA